MICPSFKDYVKYLHDFNNVEINKDKEKNLRFNVWDVKPEDVHNLVNTLSSESLPGRDESRYVLNKVDNALKRVSSSKIDSKQFIDDIVGSDKDNIDTDNVSKSIALYDIMEAVKGEADKARNNDIDLSQIAVEGVLPALPLSRVAASIGRKIMYFNQERFKSNDNSVKSSAEIEQLYYIEGLNALSLLEEKGYVNLHDSAPTIRDYENSNAKDQKYSKTEVVTDVRSVSLNTKKLGIKKNNTDSDTLTAEAAYFLNRTESNTEGTELGNVVDLLTAVKHITQPSTISIPDTGKYDSSRVLADSDPHGNVQDPKTESARQKLYKNPLYVNKSVHKLLSLIQEATADNDKGNTSASKFLSNIFKGSPIKFNSLFGIKDSDNFAVDRKESITGQNLSKTVPLDDIVDNYSVFTDSEGNPTSLHMAMKGGRNQRLYYDNSVLNAHAHKQSRHMLTSGEQTISYDSDNFDRIVYKIAETLEDSSITSSDIVDGGNDKLDKAMKVFNSYDSAKDIGIKVAALSRLPDLFPGVDFSALVSALSGINDIRSNKGNTEFTTEFMDSADATAQGGTLTLQQAYTTNANVQDFMERVGIITDSNGEVKVEGTLDDIYGLLSEGINNFISGEGSRAVPIEFKNGNIQDTLQQTLNLLFGGDAKGTRNLSKDATMPFIYGQGQAGATSSMSDSIAKRIIDSLDKKSTREYLAFLLDDETLKSVSSTKLKNTAGIYLDIKKGLDEKGLPLQLFKIMESEINDVYLKEFKADSKAVYEMADKVKNSHRLKVLPLGAVLSGINVDQVEKYGMPLTKIVEVSSEVTGDKNDPLVKEGGHTVLTRKQKLFKSIMDVSVIHGIDSGLMYHAVDNVIKGDLSNESAVIVHDQVIGSTELVQRVEKEYVKLNKRLVAEYDTHQQVLSAIAHYDPELAKNPRFVSLKAKIDARLEAKAKAVADGKFNENTDALIGDGDSFKEFSGVERTTRSKPTKDKKEIKNSPELKGLKDKIDNSNKGVDQTPLLESLAPESELISRYLATSNKPVVTSVDNTFDTKNNQITVKDKLGDKAKQIIEHEIVHHNTAGYIAKSMLDKKGAAYTDIKYFQKAIQAIGKVSNTLEPGSELQRRMQYISSRAHTDAAQIAELVAVLTSETEVANGIYKAIAGRVPTKTLKERIASFVKGITSLFTSTDFSKEVNADKLQDALVRTLENGRSYKEDQTQEAIKYESTFKVLRAGIDPTETMRYLNSSVSAMIDSRLEKDGKRLTKNLHENLKARFPLYTDAVDKFKEVYNGSEAMQQLVHTITGEGTNKTAKANLLAQSAKINGDQRSSISHQQNEFKKALRGVSKEDKDTVGRFVMQLPLHDYFVNSRHLDTAAKIDAEVARLEKSVGSVNKRAIVDVNDLIDRNVRRDVNTAVTDKEGGSLYNLSSRYKQDTNDTHGNEIRSLLVLKSIQAIGSKEFEKLLGNADLVSLIKDNLVANKLNLLKVGTPDGMRDSLLPDYWKESPDLRPVTIKDLVSYAPLEENGWKVLREPTKDRLGIMYKELVDSTDLQGAHTDINLKSTDIDITRNDHKKYNNVTSAGENTFKLVLTPKERETAGIDNDFVETLIRGTAHSIAVSDSQVIRDAIVKSEQRYDATDKTKLTGLVDILEADNVDAPWFVKLDEEQTYTSLHKSIRAKYKVVDGRASEVQGELGTRFSEEVHLVRKDMSHYLLGGHSKSPFQNKQMKWAVRLVKDITAGTKIGMVVLNPIKIAIDNVSNISYLSVSGASPLFIAKNYRDISRQYNDYQELLNKAIVLKVRIAANPDDKGLKNSLDKIQSDIDANPVGDLSDKGFVNSLGSDIVARSSDVSSGLQADMETALGYILKNKKGNMNLLAHFITKLHKAGYQSEDFVKHLSSIVARSKDGKGIEKQMELSIERIKSIKTDDDIVSYVSQYTTSPGSELVRIGSSMTDLTDVLAKETLYRHAMENEGMSAEAARIHVLDSFPDYKENLPLSVKQLSDVGIVMFPSFWLRIQKAIYRMARDKPVGLSTELAIEHYVTGNVSTIFDANIINKAESFGGIFHTPLASAGIGSLVPLNLY